MNDRMSKLARCAVYTRKSTEYNLDLAFNSLDAQREACEAYIKSQAQEGWQAIPTRYNDGSWPNVQGMEAHYLHQGIEEQVDLDECLTGRTRIVPSTWCLLRSWCLSGFR